MKQKKIIIFMPSIEGGGVEKNLFLISNFLSSKFKKTKLITSSNNTQKISKKIHITSFKLFNFFKNRYLKILFSCVLLFIELLKNKDVIILSFQANLYAILIAKFFRVKIIVRLNSSPSGWLSKNWKKRLFKKIYSLSNLIIVNSYEFQKELWTRLKLKSYCIYNPLDKNIIIKKSKYKIKNNPFKIKGALKIVNLGRLVDQKDHLTLLKSICSIQKKIKVELIIIGSGQNENKLKSFIKKNELTKIVKILEFKDNPYPIIKLSELFVLTSKYEGLPNVLLESIVLKKFIISSDCPTGPKEILDYGKRGILFKVGSHRELTKKILEYSKNKKKLRKKTKIAFNSLYKYDFKKNLNKYYFQIINLS